jgi:polysaccharide pyruvyl transferase WcaK-like protein
MRDLEDIGVQNRIVITGDPAVLLTQNKRRVRLLRHPPTVVVCMRHWYRDGYFVPDFSANQNMETSVAASLDYLVSKWGAQIHFLPFRVTQPDDDRQAAVAIVERMHRQETVTFHQHPATHKEAIDVLSTADLVVGMRLHSLILATALGIPCIALSYSPKVRRYMDQVQQGTFCWEIEDVERNVLCEAMDYIFQNYGQVSTDLVAVADSTTRQLDENVRLLSQLLSYRSH